MKELRAVSPNDGLRLVAVLADRRRDVGDKPSLIDPHHHVVCVLGDQLKRGLGVNLIGHAVKPHWAI